jgi:hypothetical protein
MDDTQVNSGAEKLLRAYRSVFGLAGKRTEAQTLVLSDLESIVWRNGWIPNDKGEMDTHRAAIAEGRRILSIEIIQKANSRPGEEKSKPTVKKD